MLALDVVLEMLAELGFTGVDLWQVSSYYNNRGHIATDADADACRTLRTAVADLGLESERFEGRAALTQWTVLV